MDRSEMLNFILNAIQEDEKLLIVLRLIIINNIGNASDDQLSAMIQYLNAN